MDLTAILGQLKPILRQAGELAMTYYRQPQENHGQEDFPITEADVKVSEFLTEKLSGLGEYGVLSEENKTDDSYKRYKHFFIIDPIDGTKDFLSQTGDFCLMVGLVEADKLILGIIYNPVRQEMYYASKGGGAFCLDSSGEKSIKVSDADNFADMTMLLSRFHLAENDVKLKEKLGVGNSHPMGSAGLKMMEIAKGNAHVYINTYKMGKWDAAAGAIILEEAGGIITDTQGQKLIFDQTQPYLMNGFVVSNGRRHQEIIKNLHQVI